MNLPGQGDSYDNSQRENALDTKQFSNLIVRRRNGISYCIQYRDKLDPLSYLDPKKDSNDTMNHLNYPNTLLEIRMPSKGCSGLALSSSRNVPMQKKESSRGSILSNTFKFKGPCQAALTDAASVSEAPTFRIYLSYNAKFNVIMVVTIPGLFHIFSTRMFP